MGGCGVGSFCLLKGQVWGRLKVTNWGGGRVAVILVSEEACAIKTRVSQFGGSSVRADDSHPRDLACVVTRCQGLPTLAASRWIGSGQATHISARSEPVGAWPFAVDAEIHKGLATFDFPLAQKWLTTSKLAPAPE